MCRVIMSPFRGLNLGEVVRVQLGAKFSANQIIHLDHSPGSFGQNAHKNTSYMHVKSQKRLRSTTKIEILKTNRRASSHLNPRLAKPSKIRQIEAISEGIRCEAICTAHFQCRKYGKIIIHLAKQASVHHVETTSTFSRMPSDRTHR